MAIYKDTVKKLFEERIRIRKLLIKNFDICIQLNKKYPLMPWTKKYTLNQKKNEEYSLGKEIKVLDTDEKYEINDDLEIIYTNDKKMENITIRKNDCANSNTKYTNRMIFKELCNQIFRSQ